MRRVIVPLVLVLVPLFGAAAPAHASGTWLWPVVGPVIRGFDPPDSPYGSGHRGIDIAAPYGTRVVAAASGVVSFAGAVAGDLFVSVDWGGGVVASYAFLSRIDVRKGDAVSAGTVIGVSGDGHPGVTPTHLHFGVRVDGEYVDPMEFLAPPSVVSLVRLAPLTGSWRRSGAGWVAARMTVSLPTGGPDAAPFHVPTAGRARRCGFGGPHAACRRGVGPIRPGRRRLASAAR